MLDWIAQFIGLWSAVVPQAIRDLIHWTVHALASVVYTVFGDVGKAWGMLWGAIHWVLTAELHFVQAVFDKFVAIIKHYFPALYKWAAAAIKLVDDYARFVWRELIAGIALVRAWVVTLINDVRLFVYRDVWLPLVGITKQLRADLLKWGYTAWYYITHPDKLAPLLFDPLITLLEVNAWRVGQRLGQFTLALIVHNARRVAQVAEAIITAVL